MPVVTLLSDLGTADISLSKAKALLQSQLPGIELADIVHRIEPYDIQQAAYLCLSSYKYFSPGTIHLLLVNVLYGDRPRMLLAEKDGFFFIAPDNGILSLAFGKTLDKIWLCSESNEDCTFFQWMSYIILVIKLMEEHKDELHKHLSPFIISETPRLLPPKEVAGYVDCSVLYIDRYGNVLVNMTSTGFQEIARDRPFRIRLSREKEVTQISYNYNDVALGAPLCRFNSTGFLEIAVNHGSAAAEFELLPILARNISYQAVTIAFL